jgi:hypothetical protein
MSQNCGVGSAQSLPDLRKEPTYHRHGRWAQIDPLRPFAEAGRNVNERLETVVRDAAVIGNQRTVAAIRTVPI